MLLAAGRGTRMRELTDDKPKPLLPVGNTTLIEAQLERLRAAGYQAVVVNVSYRAELIIQKLCEQDPNLVFSHERRRLETAGGIVKALPHLGQRFLVLNSDIVCDHPLHPPRMGNQLAHLVMVDNPAHHPRGDFRFTRSKLTLDAGPRLTYSGIGWFDARFFRKLRPGARPLGPLLREGIRRGVVSAEWHRGRWIDVGTPERLRQADQLYSQSG